MGHTSQGDSGQSGAEYNTPTNTAGIEDDKLVPSEYFSSLPSLFFKPVNFLMIIACIDKFA